MRSILLVAGQELLVNIRRPGYIIMTVLIPVLGLIGLLIASLFGGQVGSFFEAQFMPAQKAIGYLDLSGLFTEELPQYTGTFIRYSEEAGARGALLDGIISSYFVVPADYLHSGTIVVYGTGGGFSTFAAADNSEIQSFLIAHLLAGKVDPSIEQRILDPVNVQAVALNDMGEVSTESPFSWVGDFVVPYVFSILFVITLFTTSGFLLQGVSEEKEGRVIEILLSSISATQLLAGKILGLGAVGLVQVIIWFGAGALLLSAAAALFAMTGLVTMSLSTVLLGLAYFVLGYLLFATLMAVAGSMGTTQRESQQIGGIFSFAAAIPWMAIGVIFANPNSPLAVILSYIPLTSPVMMLIRLGFGQVPASQVAVSLGLLLAGILASLWAGAKVFRVGLLMYGKRPGLKDLSRAFKQA
jgi:ABC-2 type transport system permease protein